MLEIDGEWELKLRSSSASQSKSTGKGQKRHAQLSSTSVHTNSNGRLAQVCWRCKQQLGLCETATNHHAAPSGWQRNKRGARWESARLAARDYKGHPLFASATPRAHKYIFDSDKLQSTSSRKETGRPDEASGLELVTAGRSKWLL